MIRARLHPGRGAGHRTLRLVLVAALAWTSSAVAQANGEPAVMKRAATLREQPGDGGRGVADLPAQAPVTRLADRQGPWVRVRSAQGATGWVHLFDLTAPTSADSGGVAGGALRSVTGFFNRDRTPRVTTATSTIGIRGLGAEDLAQAQPDPSGVTRMEALRQSEPQARQFAREAALATVAVEPLPVPVRSITPSDEPRMSQ